jgi:hypothetical protein
MKVTNLATLKAVRPSLEADLKAVLEKYGMEFAGFSGKVGPADVELKIKTKIGGAEKVQEVAEKEYKMYAPMLKLPGRRFWSSLYDRWRNLQGRRSSAPQAKELCQAAPSQGRQELSMPVLLAH